MSVIHLLPIGNADRRLLVDLCTPLMKTFRRQVAIHERDMDLEQFHDRGRLQYNSTRILLHLASSRPERDTADAPTRGDPGEKILAISAEDLFIPILTFVFGEALLGGDVAVVSYHRLQNERYGLSRDPELLLHRLVKEAMHELGHTFGLVHCQSTECVMCSSTDVEDIDLKESRFCQLCASELARNI